MIAIAKMFHENANVPTQQANSLTAPFGVIDPSDRSKKILSDIQTMTMKDPDEQARIMSKLRGY